MNAATDKRLVIEAVTALLINKELGAVARYWSSDYVQHNPIQLPGRESMMEFALHSVAKPTFKYELVRVLAESALVAVHGRLDGLHEGPAALFNIFGVEQGKIVENWEGIQLLGSANPSGRTMLDGPTEVLEIEKTKLNRQVVADFLDVVLVKGQVARASDFISAQEYRQHNPMIADGLIGLGEALTEMARHGILLQYTKVHRLIADGNFVLSHSEGSFGGKATQFFDLFRLKNRLIVEHWDVIQDLSAGSKNDNGVF